MKKSFFFLLFVALVFTSCNLDTPPTEIGLQLWSVRDHMKEDPKETVKKVGEIGYSFVETAGYADGKFYGMTPMEFKQLVEESGMQFLSSHTGKDLPTEENWDATMAWWDTCIAAHAEAGVQYIVQPWMGGAGYDSLSGLMNYCNYFNAVGAKCAEKDIKFGYHNHAKEFTTVFNDEPVYDHMLKNTDPENVFFQLDLYWIQEGGKNAVEYFEEYPGRFKLWHVKDEKELSDTGKVDFRPAFEHAELAGLEHFIVEVERYNYDPMVSVQKSYEFLQESDFIELFLVINKVLQPKKY